MIQRTGVLVRWYITEPKMGKSFLCVDFAGYLARNRWQSALYRREEGWIWPRSWKLRTWFIPTYKPKYLKDVRSFFPLTAWTSWACRKDLKKPVEQPQQVIHFRIPDNKGWTFQGRKWVPAWRGHCDRSAEKGRAVQNGRYNQIWRNGNFHSFWVNCERKY